MAVSMNAKHYLWVANLLILGLIVWTGLGLGLKWWGERLQSGINQGGPVTAGAAAAPELKTLAHYAPITQKNMFGGQPEEEPAPAPTENQKPDQPVQTKAESKDFRLLGTVFDQSGDYSRAIIEEVRSRQQALYGPGQDLGDGRIVQIHPQYVVLRRDGEEVRLDIYSEYEASPPTRRQTNTKTTTTRVQSAPSNESIAREVGQNSYVVSRDALGEHMGNLNFFMSHVRIQPYFKDGQSHGFKLAAVRAGSPVYDLGFRRGDVILEVNDVSVGRPEDLINLYRQMQQLENVSVTVERNGQQETLNYSLR
jgi:general secretion pathway protein C